MGLLEDTHTGVKRPQPSLVVAAQLTDSGDLPSRHASELFVHVPPFP